MLKRKIYYDMLTWKDTPGHKALVIKGARQVGKTFIVRAFASENYDHYVEINFQIQPEFRKVFAGGCGVDELVSRISLVTGDSRLDPGSLIFLDEIQECPEARGYIKAFVVDGRYDVIASGSMLGVSESRLGVYKHHSAVNIGVGYEDPRTMHALDFEEYLWARGVTEEHIARVREKIRSREQIDDLTLSVFSSHFRSFMVTGGMPEVVDLFSAGDTAGSVAAMERILSATKEDINRYNEGVDVIKARRCFESIPSQLGETNKKFTFSRVSRDYGASTKQKYFENTEWIGAAGYGNFCHLLKQPVLPLRAQEIQDQYKIYLFDTGLLVQMYGPAARMAVMTGDCSFNGGSVAENVVAECLVKAGVQPRTYRKNSGPNRMELDFVIELGTDLSVIEVKSGKHRESPSLNKVPGVFRVDRRIMFDNGNISVDAEGVEHYPLFSAAFVKDMIRQPEGFDENGFPADEHGLR